MTQHRTTGQLPAQPVQGLQYMLGRLALDYDFLPPLAVDGLFGERTLEAVMLFQRELHPPVTGVVDRGTWNAIRARWQALEDRLAPPRPLRAFPGEGSRVAPGERKEYFILPQTMFQVLSRHFEGLAPGQTDGAHTGRSVDNVRWLQRAAGLEETGVLDRPGWERLSRLYEVAVVKDLEEASPRFTGGWG